MSTNLASKIKVWWKYIGPRCRPANGLFLQRQEKKVCFCLVCAPNEASCFSLISDSGSVNFTVCTTHWHRGGPWRKLMWIFALIDPSQDIFISKKIQWAMISKGEKKERNWHVRKDLDSAALTWSMLGVSPLFVWAYSELLFNHGILFFSYNISA